MKKFLIIGLGNIGAEYANTRHNVGFKILDALAGASNISFEPNRYADTAKLKIKGRSITLVKPTTYMNLSGKAVNYYLQTEKIDPENILIITDDLALPFGTLRMRTKGSDGGHNGLKHIIQTLNSSQFTRIRFGVGNEFSKGNQVDYVLGEWSSEEEEQLKERIETSIEMVKSFVAIGASQTMTQYNGK
ncbi:MAG: aminoacyl-tRNA hydrolase [Flavobacteriales bacterium]|nr:aminoacyl-tRNA hydrolase [Flavobacteriales bacterium]